jgi:Family of unknown function (DUF6159)
VEAQPSDSRRSRRGRIRRGWKLTGIAWKLIRNDGTMLALAFMGIGFALASAALVFYFGGYFEHPQHPGSRFALLAMIALYPSTFAGVFFNVALACAASAAFDGDEMTIGEALRMARGKLGRIAAWSLIVTVVGVLIAEVANRLPGGGRLFARLLGAAWNLATILVVPVLAIEGIGSIDALKRSTGLLKRRWGEELSGIVAINAWSIVVALPLGILVGVGAALTKRHPGTGIALIGLGALGLVVLMTMLAATRQVFAVALYRFAIDAPVGGFSAADLENPFAGGRSGEKRKSWILRIGGGFLALFAVLVVLAAIFGHRHHTAAEGYFHLDYAAANSPAFAAGAPVVYAGRPIGEVLSSGRAGAYVRVVFRVDPRYSAIVETRQAFVGRSATGEYLRIGSPPPATRGSPG